MSSIEDIQSDSYFSTSKNLITGTFSPSSPFTASFTFSPKRSAYPDGLGNAKISGKSSINTASAAVIGATAGISVVLLIVATVFLILYLNARRRILRESVPEFSDLIDSQSDTSSYSYSYYEYEYEYVSDDNNDTHSNKMKTSEKSKN